MHKKLTLMTKMMILVVVIVLLPILSFELYYSADLTSKMKNQEMNNLSDTAQQVSANVEDSVSALLLQFLTVYQSKELREIANNFNNGNLENFNQLESQLCETMDHTAELNRTYRLEMQVFCMISREDGQIITNTATNKENTKEICDYAKRQLNDSGDSICWLGTWPSWNKYNSTEKIVVLAKELNYPKKNNIIYLAVPETSLNSVMNGQNRSENEIYLVDSYGKVFSGPNKEQLNKSITGVVKNISVNQSEWQSNELELSGRKKSMGICKSVKKTPLYVICMRSYDSVFSNIQKTIFQMICYSFLIIIIFIIIALLYIKKAMAPLEKLSSKMKTESIKDQLSQEFIIPSGTSLEIHSLYQSYYNLTDKISKLIILIKSQEKQKRAQEFALLQAQLKPHFLFNTLMSIRCAVSNGNVDKASDMLLYLSNFMRSVIVKPDEIVCIGEEVKILKNYIELQNLRSVLQVSFQVNISSGLENLNIPKMLLQPLIENSIIHGLSKQKEGRINLSIEKFGSELLIAIHDNGSGFEINPLQVKTAADHLGVHNVLARVKLYYGKHSEMTFRNENGTTAVIKINDFGGGKNV